MRISKKLYTTLIITVLTISSLIAAIPMASAEITGDPYLCATWPPGSTTALTTGTPGTSVDVVGNSTGGYADAFATVTVYWDGLSGPVLGEGDADHNGDYRIRVKIPADINGTHWIVVNDGETESGGAAFEVIPTLSVASIPPAYFPPTLALPGDDLTVTGHGYAPDSDITLFFNQTTDPTINFVITAPAFTTNGTGSFSGTITVPAIDMADFDMYVFNATDEDGNSATSMVSIDYYITCYPGSGPTGIDIWIFGRIAASVAYDLRFNGALIATGTSDSTGSYFEIYTIPAVLSPGKYPIDIWWALTEVRSVNFTVAAQPTIVLGTDTGIAGDVVTITGTGFVGGADITLYFGTTVVNSTDMDDRFGPTNDGWYTFPAGAFSEEFTVPSLAPGIYTVSVVDSWGAASQAGVFFNLMPTPLITVETRATEYYQGDLMSLYTWSNIIPSYDVEWEITDTTGNIYIYGYIYTSDWNMISTNSYMVPYYRIRLQTYWNNMIPDDAPVGVWNFTAYNTGTSAKVDTNLFSVSAKPDMQDVIDEIDECCSNMTALLETLDGKIVAINGTIATISTTVGTINLDITELKPTIITTSEDVVTIKTSVGNIEMDIGDLSDLGGTISNINNNVVTIKTIIGDVQTKIGSLDVVLGVVAGDTAFIKASVDSLDTVLGVVAGDTAIIKTSLGTINGTITDMNGTIATIQTDLGTVKLDLASVKTDVSAVKTDVEESLPVTVDMMPIWIAVVLSLIAAIAAIFAVVTIRQKIAG